MEHLVEYGSAVGALVVTAAVAVATWSTARLRAFIARRSSVVANVAAVLLAAITSLASHVLLQESARWWVNRKLSHDDHILYVWIHPGIMWTVLALLLGVILGRTLLRITRSRTIDSSRGRVG